MVNLGIHPDNKLQVYGIRSPFGPYIQCGEPSGPHPRPLGCWLPSGWDITDLTLDTAVKLLAFPKTLGVHPVTRAPVTIHLQQIGATIRSEVLRDNVQRHIVTRLRSQDDVFNVTLQQAVEILEKID